MMAPLTAVYTSSICAIRIDKNGRLIYTVWSSGDNAHPYFEAYKFDTTYKRIFFEYRDNGNDFIGQYAAPNIVLSYRIHKLGAWRPDRPVVANQNGFLRVLATMDLTWYKKGTQKDSAMEKIPSGETFKPNESGVYCVAVKYGIGYSVSLLIHFVI